MTVKDDEHDSRVRFDENNVYGITIGGFLIDTMKQLADQEVLVDVVTVNSPGTDRDLETLDKETHGVRIIMVGEDHIVLGPKRPVFSSFIPFSEILMVRIAEEPRDSDCYGFFDFEDDDETFLIPDGKIHYVNAADIMEAISDTSVVVILIRSKQDGSKVRKILEGLAKEYSEDVLFIEVILTEDVMVEFGVDETPAVVILSEDEIVSQIVGIKTSKQYQDDIDDALDSVLE